jgi:hypothetical protein
MIALGPVSATSPEATSSDPGSRAAPGQREKLRAALRLPEPLAAISLFVLATAFAALLLIRPRAVAPVELPSLVLDRAAVAKVIAADRDRARKAPRSAKANELRAALTKQGEMELIGSERRELYRERRAQMAENYAALVAESGQPVALRLRAEAVCELDKALDLELPFARARVVIGSLGDMLQREGASFDGQLTAPRFVVRTLFKARWNLLHGLAPDRALERIELQAYYGWQALHAERLPIPQRADALRNYAKAGGTRVQEARGILYYLHDEFAQAATILAAAHAANPSFRLRNYVLGAQARAAAESDAEGEGDMGRVH